MSEWQFRGIDREVHNFLPSTSRYLDELDNEMSDSQFHLTLEHRVTRVPHTRDSDRRSRASRVTRVTQASIHTVQP